MGEGIAKRGQRGRRCAAPYSDGLAGRIGQQLPNSAKAERCASIFRQCVPFQNAWLHWPHWKNVSAHPDTNNEASDVDVESASPAS